MLENYFGRNRWYSYVTWVKWKLVSIGLEIQISGQDGCVVCAECTVGMEIDMCTPYGTPRYCMSSGSLFQTISRYCESRRTIGARFGPNVPRAWKSFWPHPIVLLGNVGH